MLFDWVLASEVILIFLSWGGKWIFHTYFNTFGIWKGTLYVLIIKACGKMQMYVVCLVTCCFLMLVSDLLAARRFAAWSSLAVSELQLSAATPLWLYHWVASLPSWIEFNCLRSAAVGKAARLSSNWLDAACRLVIPLRQVALAQLYNIIIKAASGKLGWKQHKGLFMLALRCSTILTTQ